MKSQRRLGGIKIWVGIFLILIAGVGGLIVYSFEEMIAYGDKLAARPREPFSPAKFDPHRVLGAQPPITEFPVKRVSEAEDLLNPSELVLGVTVGSESRAYPINMLTGPSREIINDRLGGKLIAATW